MREKFVQVVEVVDAQFAKPRVKLRRIRQWDGTDTNTQSSTNAAKTTTVNYKVKCHNRLMYQLHGD